MKDNPKQIKKLVILPSEIDTGNHFGLSLHNNLVSCSSCGSNLSYIKIRWGVIAEDNWYGILGDRNNRRYELREIGLVVYCAECENFNEFYLKWFYPEDKLIIDFDELDDVEMYEVKHCLYQFNQKGNFKYLWKDSKLNLLKENLLDYEKKHPIRDKKKLAKK